GRAPGTRRTVLGAPPKVSAEVDGALVRLGLVLSVRFGASVPSVTDAVRDRVRERVTGLTGLTVTEIDIEVTELVTRAERAARTD
ncbi:Asp23/Gls24 family envelope stress response protein, partial [Saccharomonospora saliphila]|uniref:Asp23/Gls24 family envelope stress response protein n=1 Tax=Saccharomonospora saliphila TaxID=369829 RepID=UPI00035E99E0